MRAPVFVWSEEWAYYGLNCVHRKAMLKSSRPVPVNVTSFGNEVSADVINLR